MIIEKRMDPSREDAVTLTRTEKMGMLLLAYMATLGEDLQNDLKSRLEMIDGAPEKMQTVADLTDWLLRECRKTIPQNQRKSLQNTVHDYEVRMVPKATPSTTNVIMEKEEFREIIDIAREKCRSCADDDTECTKCRLYKILTSVLPMEDYHGGLLCPYNLGEWAN